ncbi:MAG TPA: FKBP-type peptidyl-prolyl cis-trans isomerase [Usitatibacteraceae bacterium]|nr:FKBP-type peptidyl-prolyl cis-trans isomerase [Usitatibacteraceae bacterium]
MKKLAIAAAVALLAANACAQTATAPAAATAPVEVKELIKKDTKLGEGKVAEKGKAVLVHYTGWLYDPKAPGQKGAQFDTSVGKATPFGFVIGAGRVIKGWDEGVPGMKEGGKRTLIIPPAMAYGEKGAGGLIPPNATLLFEVEFIKAVN